MSRRTWVTCGFFFFQAEDGIRDLVRSRGLGDVYKRQGGMFIDFWCHITDVVYWAMDLQAPKFVAASGRRAVSYTNLTLPTRDLV